MTEKRLTLEMLGPVLDRLITDTDAYPHPTKNDASDVKNAFSEGVCATLSLIGYSLSDINTAVPLLIDARLNSYTPESLAYKRELVTKDFAVNRPEVNDMTLSNYTKVLEALLPDYLADTEEGAPVPLTTPVVPEEDIDGVLDEEENDGEGDDDTDEIDLSIDIEETDPTQPPLNRTIPKFISNYAENDEAEAAEEERRVNDATRNIRKKL